MGKRVQLQPHLSLADLQERVATAVDGRLCQRWQVILAVAEGRTAAAAAEQLGLSAEWVRDLVQRYNARGPDSLRDGRQRAGCGAKPLLDAAQTARLRAALEGSAADGGPWTGPRVAEWMCAELGRPVDPRRGWEYLRRLGYRAHRVTPAKVVRTAAQASPRTSGAVERGRITQPRAAYPSDLTDAEWERLAPLVESPPSGRGGRPPRWSKREILNGIYYNLRSGQAWRMMPHDLPPWKTVYHWWRVWRRAGTWQRLNQLLREDVRRQAGREPEPSAGILDSQSVKTGEKGGCGATTGARKSKGANATS